MAQENTFDAIYEVVCLIPRGRVSTYGAIAAYLGMKSGARMVGWAMNASHSLPEVPAHRVLNRVGALTGKHFFGGNRMQELLEAEGILYKYFLPPRPLICRLMAWVRFIIYPEGFATENRMGLGKQAAMRAASVVLTSLAE